MKYLALIVSAVIVAAYPFGEYLPALVPMTAWGFAGIFFAPFKHADLSHLCLNLLPLAYLLWIMRRDPPAYVLGCLAFIVVMGGLFVWWAGREAIHEGASGLALGLLAALALRHGFESAVTVSALVATGIALEMQNKYNVSWETHIGGYMAGQCFAYTAMRWYKPKEFRDDRDQSCAQAATCPSECRSDRRRYYPRGRRHTDT